MNSNEAGPDSDIAQVLDGFRQSLDQNSKMMRDMVANHSRELHAIRQERRKERFWQNIRSALFAVAMLAGPLFLMFAASTAGRGAHFKDGYVALVRVNGVIDAKTNASAMNLVNALERAFDDKKAKGVVLLINSPGDSPVQSSIVRDRLIALRQEHPKTKVWAIGEDMMTSGAYFISMGSDHVCANRSSVVGSIGFIQDSWGFDKLIDKLDIERRVFTAGASKARMDMFKPLSVEDQLKIQELLGAVHEHFKDVVRAGRGQRLKAPEALLFSWDFWTGEQALELGLIDRLCDLPEVLKGEYGVMDAKDYTPPPNLLSGLARTMGAELQDHLVQAIAPQLFPE